MKIRSFINFCFALFLCSILTVTHASTSNTPANPYSDPEKNIIVNKSNPQFTITLASNRTTGYSWHLLNYDSLVLTLVNHAYQAPEKNMPGADGQEVWIFKINKTGFVAPQISKIALLYARPWNLKDNSKQVEFTIVTQ